MRRLLPLALLVLLAAFAALPGAASASRNQESILMDTADLLNADDETVRETVMKVRDLGITRLRVAISWMRVAPEPNGLKLPLLDPITKIAFNPKDPATYPASGWYPYDRQIRLAREAGLEVYVDLNGFAPRWATPGRWVGRLDQIYKIAPADYQSFAQAVGTRYSGSYRTEDGTKLPKVRMWSLYNEPNQGGWLAPQFADSRILRKRIPLSPRLYREMVYAGYEGLKASGHGSEPILIGELAPSGRERRGQQSPMRPLFFMRELFCLDERLRPYRGTQARARGCTFFKRLPGSGFAVHPYGLLLRPGQLPRSPDDTSIASLGRVAKVLDRAAALGRVRKGMPIWNTEFGWQTRPDPYVGILTQRHADYMMEAEYISWKNPRLKSFAQYLWRDEPKRPASEGDERKRWGSWQSGLLFESGKPKPALRAFELPMQVVQTTTRLKRSGVKVVVQERSRAGRAAATTKLRVWGMIRPRPGKTRTAQLEVRRPRTSSYRRVGPVFKVTGRGYFTRTVSFRKGLWRFVWLDAPGQARHSRAVRVPPGAGAAPPAGGCQLGRFEPAEGGGYTSLPACR